mgnify:CR=1 FL=1
MESKRHDWARFYPNCLNAASSRSEFSSGKLSEKIYTNTFKTVRLAKHLCRKILFFYISIFVLEKITNYLILLKHKLINKIRKGLKFHWGFEIKFKRFFYEGRDRILAIIPRKENEETR